MSKQMERNRRQAICAGLIASTIVTADCADEESIACLESDDDQAEADPTPVDGELAEAPLAELESLTSTIAYELVPLITPLPLATPIAPEIMPCAVAMDAAVVDPPVLDAVSQAGPFVALGEEPEASPKLTARPRRRATTGGARPSAQLTVTAKLSIAEALAEAAKPQEVARAEKPAKPKIERSELQDEYMAFGVNGR